MLRNALLFVPLFVLPVTASAQDEKKVDQAWIDMVAQMKPAEQVKAVAAKMQELNFKLPEAVTSKIEGSKNDLAPIRGIKGLLYLNGKDAREQLK